MLSTEIFQRWKPRTDPEIINATPFVIRGHHLANLIPIAVNWSSSSEAAQKLVSNIGRYRCFYAVDVLGNTEEERDAFQENLTRYFERFRSLPPDFPVRITAGQEDGICAGCAVGNHCAKKENSDEDAEYVSEFIQRAAELSTEGRPTGQLERDNGEPMAQVGLMHAGSEDEKSAEDQFSVITTAQVVREVLRNW
ncbi:MAG: hypothetical protein HYV38_01265 [Candidatus Levybacteria bacterium]|nr:hypothetical protein [Candidatus Levybacteria bacterium]